MMYPIALIAIALAVLTVVMAGRLLGCGRSATDAGGVRFQALPFWGVIALLLGFLGQAMGHFKALSAMIAAETISPQAVLMGLRECFITTLTGLVVCILALLAWGLLRTWHRVRTGQTA